MQTGLTRAQEFALAAVTGVTVANAYYIHPIISEIAHEFGVDAATIGLVPAFNQLALACGIFLLLPLGDRFGNRTLCIIFACAQVTSLAGMLLARDFTLFLTASTVLGFFTIAPYILPAYASKRVPPERLGHVTAVLTAGIIVGILVARTGAGVVTEYFGWRVVYAAATGLMIAVTLALPFVMEGKRPSQNDGRQPGYTALLASIFPLLKEHREVILSGIIQALNFGIFLSIWLGLALHLTSAGMGFGVDMVGYLSGFAAISIYVTPRLGRWADRVGARIARLRFAILQLMAVTLLWPFGESLLLLLIPIIVMNAVGPSIDVTSRMTFLSLDPAVRTRLMTAFIVLMFTGGGLASWGGTAAYEWLGWTGNAILAGVLSIIVTGLSWFAVWRYEQK